MLTVPLHRPPHQHPDRGYVTAETAVVLPVLLVVLSMALWVLAAVSAQLRCTDAAGLAARAAARGEVAAEVARTARAAAPGSAVDVEEGPQTVSVRVRLQVRPLGGALRGLPALSVEGRAVAAREDRVAP